MAACIWLVRGADTEVRRVRLADAEPVDRFGIRDALVQAASFSSATAGKSTVPGDSTRSWSVMSGRRECLAERFYGRRRARASGFVPVQPARQAGQRIRTGAPVLYLDP